MRRWLARARFAGLEADDLIQEAYCRIVANAAFEHIASGRAYFFTVVRNLAFETVRRSRVVALDQAAHLESLNLPTGEPSPERAAIARQTLAMVQDMLQTLPERCRTIFTLRKVHGRSQKEIALLLGVSENVVEKQIARGMRALLLSVAAEAATGIAASPAGDNPLDVGDADRRKQH